MKIKTRRIFKPVPTIFFAIIFAALPIFAETDSNANSPTPILLSASDSNNNLGFSPNDESPNVILYVTNLDLMSGEGATAFRVYIKSSLDRWQIFSVTKLKIIDSKNRIYAMLVDWRPTKDQRDAELSLAWRGLESNRIRLNAEPLSEEKIKSFLAKDKQTIDEADYVGYRGSGDRIRFLEQATFGPTDALDLRIRRIGLRVWLGEQFSLPYPSASNPYPPFSLKPTFPAINCNGMFDNGVFDPDPDCFNNHYTMYPVQNWFYKEAFYGDAQLRHRVAWALAQHWVISGVETQQSSHLTGYHKVLSRNAFGNWRTLMREMTLNPGMGNYLNMRSSTKDNPNENFAREVLQLFNIGLYMLNQNGTLQLDNNGDPIPTYNQERVYNLMKTLTGWRLCEKGGGQCPNRVPGAPNYIDSMIVTTPTEHNLSAKTLLNYSGSSSTENIPACNGCEGAAVVSYANNSLNQALDNIYNHPNVAPFVSKFLIKQMVTGDPSPAYVGRISAVFNANRTSPTQLQEVIRAILLDPEARGDVKTDPHYGKMREPIQFLTNLARHFDVRSADRSVLSDGVLTTETKAMEQVVFMSPTVFNFYQPDYIVPGTTFNGPEFALYSTVTSISRINFANTLIFDRININTNRRVTAGTSISLENVREAAEADPSGNRLMDLLNTKMLHGTMSPQMRATILNVVQTVPAFNPLLRAKRAVYLVATSSQYQVQR
jgi:uncharacterized protein (DUF1800 family)